MTIEKNTPLPILPEINNKPIAVSDILYLIVAVLSFIVILTSISLILVLLLNELNSKSNYLRGIPTITQELLSSGQTIIDYITNNYSSKSSVYFFGISSAIKSEQKNPFPGDGGFAILYNSSTTGYRSIYAFSYNAQIKAIRTLDGTWDSDWADL